MANEEKTPSAFPRPAGESTGIVSPDDHLKNLGLETERESLFVSLFNNLKNTLFPPKLPPLEVTSKPVEVKSMWGLYNPQKKAWLTSMAIHIGVVALAFSLATSKTVQVNVARAVSLVAPDISPYIPQVPKPKKMGGGGGGGARDPLPASKGRLPRVAPRQFTPPAALITNPNPKLAMEPTIIAPPDVNLPQVNMAQYGDPLGRIGPLSSGPGSGGGIGSGSGGGVGPGKGPGYGPGEGGGFGGGVFRVGGGVTAPVLIYKVEPEYSEEARKAKFQGTVLLYIEVNERGLPQNPRVIRPLGMGLDEKAIEAVMKWRFQPGRKDGKPVTVAAQVEVNFRLL